MKTIIAGSRSFRSPTVVATAVAASGFSVTEVVSGTAYGVDALGEAWAKANGCKVVRFPARWSTQGIKAGHIRNRRMAEYADALIAIWDGTSGGTAHMITTARDLGLKVYVHLHHEELPPAPPKRTGIIKRSVEP